MKWSITSPTRVSKSKRRHEANPVRSPGAVRNKIDTQVTYGVSFIRSIYGSKQNS
jgi:hypothetical protein